MTILALICGLAAHVLKQMIAAKRAGTWPGLVPYLAGFWQETLLATVCSVGLFLALPELAALIPALGVVKESVVLAFLCGFVGNSFADILGERAKRLAGG